MILLAGKARLSWRQMHVDWVGHLFSPEMGIKVHEKELSTPKAIPDCKKWKIWHILCLRPFGQQWVTRNQQLSRRSLSPGRIIVSFWTFWMRMMLPRQIKPKILEFRIQSNLELSLYFVSCEEKDCYGVVSPGQLSFDCHSCFGPSHVCKVVFLVFLARALRDVSKKLL